MNSRTVNGLVGGIPLALKIVGTLVSEVHSPNQIIRELKQNLIETLTPEDVRPEKEKLRPVLELSYKHLDYHTQECGLYLSHFPGSFSHEAALHILSSCTNNNPTKSLTSLTDRSLLEPYSYAGQPRYQFHKLIKEYLKDVESHKPSVESSKITITFNSSFLTHYTQVLHGFVNRYNEIPQDDENIGRFEYESHNFECLLDKIQVIHRHQWWPAMSIINFTRALTCDLMLEIFTIRDLLKAAQRTLMMFEYRMDSISAQTSATETLNLYHDLVLTLRRWIQLSAVDCSALCEETFPWRSFASRYHAIDKQLAMTNHSTHDYYSELKFPYYNPFNIPVCFSDCMMSTRVSHVGAQIGIAVTLHKIHLAMLVRILFQRFQKAYQVCLFAVIKLLSILVSIKPYLIPETLVVCIILSPVLIIVAYIITCILIYASLTRTGIVLLILTIFPLVYTIVFKHYMIYFLFPIWYPLLYAGSVVKHHYIILTVVYLYIFLPLLESALEIVLGEKFTSLCIFVHSWAFMLYIILSEH